MTRTPSARPRASLLTFAGLALALFVVPEIAHAQSSVFRTRLGIAGGATVPIENEGFYSEAGSAWQAQIGVGDDPCVVSIVVGYTSFGGHPFQNRVASVTEFELRSEWTVRHQERFSPVGQLGLGLYRVADPAQGERRIGFRTGAGMRWAPNWQTAVAVVASFAVVVDQDAEPRRWAGLSVELLRWMD